MSKEITITLTPIDRSAPGSYYPIRRMNRIQALAVEASLRGDPSVMDDCYDEMEQALRENATLEGGTWENFLTSMSMADFVALFNSLTPAAEVDPTTKSD